MAGQPQDAVHEARQWWLGIDSRTDGPYSASYIVAGLRSGTVPADAYACPVGGQEWRPVSAWVDFASARPEGPPRVPAPAAASGPLLTSPHLPAAANAICVYAIVVAPVLWCVYNLACCVTGLSFHEESRLFPVELGMSFVHALVSLGVTVLLVIGGLHLRALKKSGPFLIQTAIWIGIGAGVLVFAFTAGMMLGADESDYAQSTDAQTAIGVFLGLIALCELAFTIFALIWLYMYSKTLPLRAN